MGITRALALATVTGLYGTIVANTTWTRPQWELAFKTVPNVATSNVPVWDVNHEQLAPSNIPALMSALRANNRYIICYVNVGSLDTPGEFFLDIRRNETRALVKARLQRMASYGCHAIEPDNLDSYSFSNGFGLTVNDAMDYMSWVAASVHDLGMAVGLKNCGDLVTPYNVPGAHVRVRCRRVLRRIPGQL
ncbi:hypothetical protein PBRA_009627 [Plasmodiophora brassicae]|uniref:Glycoside-hydrolase family GH114 TIM-barrel domain-containing protein n=1 Tax=Plasmodiophora brassicae TaxID=37360 RepID=A0A0G4IJ41_PLABS|nr:hypothetical protein PBRA_009627 [Plasmodiophora brassicae]